jgi:hypothetical protein
MKHTTPPTIALIGGLASIAIAFAALTLDGLSSTSRAKPVVEHAVRVAPKSLVTASTPATELPHVLPWESNPFNTPPIPAETASVPAWQIPPGRPVDEPPRERPRAPDPWTAAPPPRN